MTAEIQEWGGPIVVDDPSIVSDPFPYERSIAAAFLTWPEDCIAEWKNRVSGLNNPGQALFRDDRCRNLVQKVIKLVAAGVNPISLWALRNNSTEQELRSFGGWAYISKHWEFLLVGGNFDQTFAALMDQYRLNEYRLLIETAAESVTDGQSLNQVIAMVGDQSRRLLRAETGMLTPTPEMCGDEMEKKVTEANTEDDIPTSFRKFAEFVGEYKRGQITLVGAPPGNGKTAWAMQEIQCAVEHGFTVDAFLMESTWGQFSDRYIARNFTISASKFKNRRFTHADLEGIHSGMSQLSHFNNHLFMSKAEGYSATQIDAMIQQRKATTGQPCDMIVVDHLDCMNVPREKGESQFEAMKRTVLQLRNIAGRENASMLLLSQLSVDAIRQTIGQNNKLPTIEAFRGGTPVESAKVVVILNKDKQAMLDGSPVVEQQIVICKANDGSTGFVRSLFLKPFVMHVEDNNAERRQQYRRWLEALNFPLDQKRKDTREK